MTTLRKLNRRSFLARVAGGAAAGSLMLVAGRAGAQVTDCDRGTGADPAGRGTGRSTRTGVTDSDSGAAADPSGCGRGGRPGAVAAPRSDQELCQRPNDRDREIADPPYQGRGPHESREAFRQRVDPGDLEQERSSGACW